MKKILLILIVSASVIACNQNQEKKDDPEILKNILNIYFDGLKNSDIEKLNSITTKDFILFEDGKIWTNDSIISFQKQFTSMKGEWKFDKIKVNIDNESGDISYLNHGEFVINDTIKMKFDWVESATFRKVDGKWKMNLLHSTVRK